MKKFQNEFLVVNDYNNILAECNSITFWNTGTNVATVNNMKLQPGASWTSPANRCEWDETKYSIAFILPAVPATGLYNELTIIRKRYVN